MDELETLQSIRRGLEEMDAGKMVSAAQVHEELPKLWVDLAWNTPPVHGRELKGSYLWIKELSPQGAEK